MEKSVLMNFLNTDKDLFLQLKNGFHYRCRIKEINEESILIHDVLGEIHFVSLDYIRYISFWRDGK